MVHKFQNLTYAFVVIIFGAIGFFCWFKYQRYSYIKVTQKIYHILDLYRITYDIDAASVDPTHDIRPKHIIGIAQVIQQILAFVSKQQTINMVIVGFPFKSPNHKTKTLGDLPDMAERKSLEYLQGMLNDIKAVYAPGAQVTIFCDGIPFAEFFGIEQQTVVKYETTLQSLVSDLPNIRLYTSSDILHDHKLNSLDDIIKMIEQYCPSNNNFKASIEHIAEVTRKRIALDLDHEAGRKMLKRYKLDNIVSRLIKREAQLRDFINKHFLANQFIRLTVHFSEDMSKKIGIKLSPNSDITPYHGVLIDEDSAWSIKFKKDIDTKNYTLMSKDINGIKCSYFKRIRY